jgi:hypothetical protein
MITVFYKGVSEFEGWDRFVPFIESFIKDKRLRNVCEIGGGAAPALSAKFVAENGLYYTVIDEDGGELKKSKMNAEILKTLDICAADDALPGGPFDLLFSRMTAEHFRQAKVAHVRMNRSLAPGGYSVHSFATLYSFPFVVNRILPEAVVDALLSFFAPRDREAHDKFRAYYDRCFGPIKSQQTFFESCGFEILEYRGYFGHAYYAKRLKLLHGLNCLKARYLMRNPIPLLTSYATVILRKPVCDAT